MKPDIIKCGAIILRNKKLLIVKPKSKDYWIFVGGKPESGETLEQALIREVLEELSVKVVNLSKLYLISPIEKAIGNKDNRTVQIFAFIVNINDQPKANSEIEKIHWLSRKEFECEKFKLGSVLHNHAIPKLIKDGMM